jgi:branched-chain amino acid transport system substrate-binding protein
MADHEAFRIHSVCSDTGVRLAYRFHRCASLIAADELNAAGGVLGRPVEIIDHATHDARAIDRLYAADARYLFGPNGSSAVASSLPSTTPRQMLQAGWSNATDLGDARRFPYYFQLHFTAEQQALVFMAYLVGIRGHSRIGVMYERSVFGESGLAAIRRIAGEIGLTLPVQPIPLTAARHQREVTALRRQGVEALALFVTPQPTVRSILCGLAESGWFPTIVGQSALLDGGLFTGLPDELAKDCYATTFRKLAAGRRGIADRQWRYAVTMQQRLALLGDGGIHMGLAPHMLSPYYDWVHLLAQAVTEASSWDTRAVKAVLEGIRSYDGMIADMSFDAQAHNGVPLSELTLAATMPATDQPLLFPTEVLEVPAAAEALRQRQQPAGRRPG